jgi:hypothetical protein
VQVADRTRMEELCFKEHKNICALFARNVRLSDVISSTIEYEVSLVKTTPHVTGGNKRKRPNYRLQKN